MFEEENFWLWGYHKQLGLSIINKGVSHVNQQLNFFLGETGLSQHNNINCIDENTWTS